MHGKDETPPKKNKNIQASLGFGVAYITSTFSFWKSYFAGKTNLRIEVFFYPSPERPRFVASGAHSRRCQHSVCVLRF